MRREGYELQIGQPPQVIIKEVEGSVRSEPVEELSIDLPETVSGERPWKMVTLRKGELLNMRPKADRMLLRSLRCLRAA